MDPEKPVVKWHITRCDWDNYSFDVRTADDTKTFQANLIQNVSGYSGVIFTAVPAVRKMSVIFEGEWIWLYSIFGEGGQHFPHTDNGVLCAIGRTCSHDSQYLIESALGQYVMTTVGKGKGNREIRLIPEGKVLDVMYGEVVGELVGEIVFNAVGKRLYAVTFQRDVPQHIKLFWIFLAILQGRIDETIVRPI